MASLVAGLRASASTVDGLCRDSQALGGDQLEVMLTEVSHCLHRALIALDADAGRPLVQISRLRRRRPVLSSAIDARARVIGRSLGDRFERLRGAVGSALPAPPRLPWRGERGRPDYVKVPDTPVADAS